MDGMIAFTLGEIPVYSFGLIVALAVLCFCGVLGAGMAKRKLSGFPMCAVFAVLTGFVLSRLMFCLLDQAFLVDRPFSELFRPDYGGYSMLGALLGAAAGLLIACRIQKEKIAGVLDSAAPALLLFTAVCRFAEWNSEELGLSRPLKTEWLMGTFLDWEGYLKVYLPEILIAFVLFAVTLMCFTRRYRPGGTMLGGMMLFGGTQVIMESLKHDGHMSFGFVGVQHILSYLILVTALTVLSVILIRTGKKALPRAALISVIPVAGACVWIEFLLDRTPVSRWLLYAAYAVLLSFQCVLGFRMLRFFRRNGE